MLLWSLIIAAFVGATVLIWWLDERFLPGLIDGLAEGAFWYLLIDAIAD